MNESLILSSSTSSAVSLSLSLSLSRSQLVAALVIGVEWLPDCVVPTFQLMGSGWTSFLSPPNRHIRLPPEGFYEEVCGLCVYRGDLSLRFYLQITQMLSFKTSRSCYRTDFFQFDYSQYITCIQMLQLSLSACFSAFKSVTAFRGVSNQHRSEIGKLWFIQQSDA